MTEKVLVTGGAGFVGAYLTRDLVARGDEVVVFDEWLSSQILSRVVPDESAGAVKLVAGSTRNALGLMRVCTEEKVNAIVHLASPLTEAIAQDPSAGIAAACVGTANVFETARLLTLRRVVWTSSITVFGAYDCAGDGAVAEDAPHRPTSLYGSCKSLCEALSARYRADRRLDVVGLRLSVLYGAWRARGLKPSFGTAEDQLAQAAAGGSVVVSTPGKRLSWQYIEDVADILVRTLDSDTVARPVYNTNGDVATFRNYGELLQRHAPNADVRIDETQEEGDPLPYAFDDAAFRTDIGYGKQHSLEDGLRASLAQYVAAQESGVR
jgi:nucleoside-diphosphate-sugar epimerase